LNSLARSHRGLGLICALLLACLVASPIVARAGSDEDLTKADWSVNAPHDLAHNPPSKDAVSRLIGLSPDNPSMGKVCDFHFADLRHQGTLSLVVSDDGGGKADCNDVDIFDKVPHGLEDRQLDAGSAYLDGVEDINGDGHFEAIIDVVTDRENVGEYYGKGTSPYCNMCVTCTEYWPRVFAWTGSAYTEVTSQYPKYYERELVSPKKQIAAIDEAPAAAHRPAPAVPPAVQVPVGVEVGVFNHGGGFGGGFGTSGSQQIGTRQQQQTLEPAPAASSTPDNTEPPDPNDLDCLKAEAAKIERLLGTSKDAGMSDAIRWANSSDLAERDFATGILTGIGTVEALKYEQTLSRDSDPDVAKSAKSELESWGKPETPETFDIESTVQAPSATDQSTK